jgi:hypothetical protein
MKQHCVQSACTLREHVVLVKLYVAVESHPVPLIEPLQVHSHDLGLCPMRSACAAHLNLIPLTILG